MPITVACTCGTSYPVKDEFAGLQVQCPGCGAVLTIPVPPGMSPPCRVPTVLKEATPPPPTLAARPSPRRSSGSGLLPLMLVPCLILGVMLLLLSGVVVTLVILVPKLLNQSEPDQPASGQAADRGVTVSSEKPPPSTAPWKGHAAPVRAVSFTVDGRLALSGSGGYEVKNAQKTPLVDNSIRFWETAGGKEHRLLGGFPEGITALAFSPNARHAVLGSAGHVKDGVWTYGPEFEVVLYDLQEQSEVRRFPGHTGEIHCVAISADGRRIVSGSADTTVRVWDADTGKELHTLKGHSKPVYSVAIAPKGNLALTGSGDQTVRLWDMVEGVEVQKYPGHADIVWAVAFSPDGKRIASAGGGQYAEAGFSRGAGDFVVRVWDTVGGEKLHELKGHTDRVGALAFSRDGKRLLSGGADAIRLWQVEPGKELTHFGSPAAPVRAVAFSPDGRHALSGSEAGSLSLWELPLGVPELVQDLRGEDARRRLSAAQALGRLGAEARPAVPDLLRVLTDSNEALRKEALAALQLIGPPEEKDVRLLVPVLRDNRFDAGRRYALESLTRLGAASEPAVSSLVETLKDPSDDVRIKSAALLGTIGPVAHDTAWKPLLELLRDPEANVRAAAAAALPKLGPPVRDEASALKPLLAERREECRRYALTALTAMGSNAADAVPALARTATSDAVPELRVLALAALAKIQPGSKESLDAFTRALEDSDKTVCEQAARSLAAAGPKNGALPGLMQALAHRNPAVVAIAAEALQKAPLDRGQLPILEKALQSPNAAVRLRAVECLGRLGADAAPTVNAVAGLLKDAQVEERRAIVVALGKLGPAAKDAGARLVPLLKDDDAEVCRETAMTLAQIESEEVAKAVPQLVKMLRITKANDAGQMAARDRSQKILVRIGKPAADGLADALEGEFSGGRPTSIVGQANAAARLVAVQTLDQMGSKADTPKVLLALAHVQGRDPVPLIRKAAKKARASVQQRR